MTITTAVSPTRALDAAFAGGRCQAVHEDGSVQELPVHRWRAEADEADHELFVRRCHGRALDVGCGPGRLTVALAAATVTALGIDVSREAVRLARLRGAKVLCHNVFERLPAVESWDRVLLADGNIGIGGDPVRMLRRVGQLVRRRGRVLAELDPIAAGVTRGHVRLRVGAELSEPFVWATVGVDAIGSLAVGAGLRLDGVAYAAGRCVATLSPYGARS